METCCLGQDSLTDDKRVVSRKSTAEGRSCEVRVEDVVREMIEYRMLPGVRTVDILTFPGIAEQSMRPVSCIVFGRESVASTRVAEACSEDLERRYYEDKFGCSRGLLWALVFHAGAFVVAAACWSLHTFLR